MLLYTRVLCPGSKRSSLEDKLCEKFGISKVVVCTDLEDNAAEIIKMNDGRWIIEDCFRITKTEFEARPVFLQRDDRIKAHFLTCFLALLLYKYLEKKVNRTTGHLQDSFFIRIPYSLCAIFFAFFWTFPLDESLCLSIYSWTVGTTTIVKSSVVSMTSFHWICSKS